MVSKLDSYIVAKFAQWALDNEYYEKMINQYNNSVGDYRDSTSAPDAIALSTINLMLSTQKKEKYPHSDLFLKNFQDIIETKKKWRTSAIDFPHMRGTLWRNSEMSFVFKVYLTDLKFERELRKNVQRFFNIDGESLPICVDYWRRDEEICFNLKMNEMALLEIFAYSCDPEWRKGSNDVKRIFEKIIQSIDPDISS